MAEEETNIPSVVVKVFEKPVIKKGYYYFLKNKKKKHYLLFLRTGRTLINCGALIFPSGHSIASHEHHYDQIHSQLAPHTSGNRAIKLPHASSFEMLFSVQAEAASQTT